jgi:hypothetical protein
MDICKAKIKNLSALGGHYLQMPKLNAQIE